MASNLIGFSNLIRSFSGQLPLASAGCSLFMVSGIRFGEHGIAASKQPNLSS